jgi:RND family efflux transporter MFP subunit
LAALFAGFLLPLTGCDGTPASSPSPAKTSEEPEGHLITSVIIERRPIAIGLERPGSLRFRRTARLYSQEEGRIEQLTPFEGDSVTAGEPLVKLDDALLSAELDAARATRAQKRLDLRRLEALSERGGASEDEIAQARTAVAVAEAQVRVLETRLQYTAIDAPFDGLLIERLAEPGDFVSKNTLLLTVADPDSLIAETAVSELMLPDLAVGDPVQIRIDALGGKWVEGRILRIHPTLSEVGRQATVELAFDAIPEGARAGQFVRVAFKSAQAPRLMVPFRALRQAREGAFVWMIDADDQALQRPVETGLRITDLIEIIDGLESGAEVITRGFLGLGAGDLIRRVQAPTVDISR